VLGVHGPSRMGEVAAHLAVGQSAVTPVIDRLERRGLVARQRSETDRRVWLVTLTRDGEAAFAEDTALYHRVAAAMLEPLDERERDQLLQLLAKVEAAVPAAGTTPSDLG
jgi:DNA-binding MarR family transcriptional regulator